VLSKSVGQHRRSRIMRSSLSFEHAVRSANPTRLIQTFGSISSPARPNRNRILRASAASLTYTLASPHSGSSHTSGMGRFFRSSLSASAQNAGAGFQSVTISAASDGESCSSSVVPKKCCPYATRGRKQLIGHFRTKRAEGVSEPHRAGVDLRNQCPQLACMTV
jgi:hypothetical protein